MRRFAPNFGRPATGRHRANGRGERGEQDRTKTKSKKTARRGEGREKRRKTAARRSRAKGRIPAVVYGSKKPTVPISVDRKALSDAFRGGAGENAIFLLKMAG